MSKFLDKLHDELFDDGGKDKNKPVVSAIAPAPVAVTPATQYPFGTTTSSATTTPYTPTASVASINPDAMKAVTDGVFININGRPSRYIMFSKIYETVGHNPQVTLATMQAMDSTITAQTILDDISVHLGLLDKVSADADATFKRVSDERLGGADKQIQNLNDLNKTAQDEIARHQAETATRIGQISQLQNGRATDEAQINQASAAAVAAEGIVKTQLLSAQSVLSTI